MRGGLSPRDAFDVPAAGADDANDGMVGGAIGGGGGGGAGAAAVARLKLVAAGGIGTGSALVLALGVWTVVARRRASVAPEDANTASGPVPAPWERGAPRGW